MKSLIKKGITTIVIIISIYLLALLFPGFLFSYRVDHDQFRVYSDKPIDANIVKVLDDVKNRISHSEFYLPSDEYSIYICNSRWRLTFFTRNGDVGGLVNLTFPNSVFIRESDIGKNSIISPTPGEDILTPKERPLSYFIAHEIMHTYQGKYIGGIKTFTLPLYIQEGYADYIGKKPDFEFNQYAYQYLNNDSTMNPESGLYNRYHLIIAYLMDVKGKRYRDIVEERIPMEKAEEELTNYIEKL